MAPSIINFHHVEIDNLGKRRRNLQPPGGESSDIFNFRKPAAAVVVTQPRRVKFHNRSNIFTRESTAAVIPTKLLPALSINTKQRLFGPPDEIPRKAINRMKSCIFSTDPEPELKPKVISAKPDRRNPITGEECAVVRHVKRHQIQRKKSNPITGEGYESPNEDGSTPRSSSRSSGSSGSVTPYKERGSAQSGSPRRYIDDKEETPDKSNKALVLYNKL